MSKKRKYDKEFVEAMLKTKEVEGKPIKEQCREKGIPYVSIVRAFASFGLKIPKKFAEVRRGQKGKESKEVPINA